MQAVGGVVGDFGEADAVGTDAAVLHLDGADDQHLALMAAAAAGEGPGRRGISLLRAKADSSISFEDVLATRGPFDTVVAINVLEHLSQPQNLLRQLRRLMNSCGTLLVTGSNVPYWHVRWNLLWGRWNYAEAGIMDRIHLRWFTLKTWRTLLEQSGFQIEIDEIAESLLRRSTTFVRFCLRMR